LSVRDFGRKERARFCPDLQRSNQLRPEEACIVVNYIIQIATGIIASIGQESKHRSILSHTQALFDELGRLDARDFLPEAR
jgi:hypothetical protein